MILSTQHKFIFVHVPKTAGWSMMDTLEPYGRGSKGRSLWRSFTRRLPVREAPDKAHFRVHDTAQMFIAKLGRDVWDRFFTFAVVRNPFTHAVSHYEYMKQYRIKTTAAKVGAMSFHDYLEYRLLPPRGKDTLFARLPDQAHFITDAAGALAVNRVLHFETLGQEFPALMKEIGLDGVDLLYVNKTRADKKPLTAYYDDATIALIHRIYDRDFAMFGYDRALPAP